MGGILVKKDNKALNLLSQLDILVACIALTILIVCTFVGVPVRYIPFIRPFTWLEEVQSACLVWIVFGAAGAAFRTGSHVAIEMIVERLPVAIQKVFQIFIALVVAVVIGFLFYQSLGFIQMFLKSGRATSMLKIPYSLIYTICPISFILQIVSFITTTIRDWNKIGVEQKMEGLD
ncbi:MAG: TRAP transporter small permease [Lawsonibacter sp.]|nr:TRAP transporter small permease [Lawsonibacter sp.]